MRELKSQPPPRQGQWARSARVSLVWFVLIVVSAWHAPVFAQAADEDVRRAKLAAFLRGFDVPLTARLFRLLLDDMEGNSAQLVLGGLGKAARLGPQWRAGNPHWEKAANVLNMHFDAERRQYGAFFTFSQDDLIANFNPPWAITDLEFAEQFFATADGKVVQGWLDGLMVPMLIAMLRADFPDVAERLATRGQTILGEANERVAALREDLHRVDRERKADAQRFNRMFRQVGDNIGQEVSQRVFAKAYARMKIATDRARPAILDIVRDFMQAQKNTS